MQQMQLIQQLHAQLQRNNISHPSLGGPINTINSDSILEMSTASVLAAKMYEERPKNLHSMNSECSTHLLDASRMALLKSAANLSGQLVQGNQAGVSAALPQIQNRAQQITTLEL